MKSNMQDNVIQLLKSHRKRKQRINLLRYELQQYINVSGKDVIDSMTLDMDNDVTHGSDYNHDKIFYIMLNYQKYADKLNIEIISEISTELVKLQKEQNRLCYYVSLLDRQEAQLIRLVYFDGSSWNEAADEW